MDVNRNAASAGATPAAPLRVLLVDDDPDDRKLAAELLHEAAPSGLQLQCAESYEAGLQVIRARAHDVYILDYHLGTHTGLDLLREPALEGKPVIILTGREDRDIDLAAAAQGASDFLVKGRIDSDLLERSIRYAVGQKRAQEALRQARDELERRVEERTATLEALNSELRATVEQQQRTERRFRGVLDSAPDATLLVDSDGTIVYSNPQSRLTFGCTAEDLLGRSIEMLVPDSSLERHEALFSRYRESPVDFPLDNRTALLARRFDGSHFAAEVSLTPLETEEGLMIAARVRDVTERARYEQALHLSEARFRAAATAASDILWTSDPQGYMTGEQPGWSAFTGQRSEEYQGHGWASAINAEDLTATLAAWQAAVRSGEKFVFQHRLRRHDGAYRTFSVRALPVRNGDNGVREWVGVHSDITEILAAQAALTEAQKRYRSLFEHMTEEVHFWAAPQEVPDSAERWTLIDANPAALKSCAETLEHPWGFTLDQVFGTGAAAAFAAPAKEAYSSGRAVVFEQRFAHLGRTCVLTVMPLEAGFVSIARDVSDVRWAQQTIEERNRELREADQRKDEFLATLAHELRNPLAPIRNAARLLKSKEADHRAQDWAVGVIDRQVVTMARLLDDLLDVSRITRRKLQLHVIPVQLSEIIDNALEVARPSIERRGHTLAVTFPPALEVVLDPLRVAQVIANLLTNAAKYTDPGGRIELTASCEASEVIISVRDSGIGIDSAYLDRVFDLFAQIPGVSDRSEGGLGIGLSLVRGLVELHHGSVSARSEGTGKGSEFVVRLPLAQAQTGAWSTSLPGVSEFSERRGTRRILVADDNVDGAASLQKLLELAGHTVYVTHDGRSALDVADRERPDVAILDIGMPGLTGYEVARGIREAAWGRRMKLVALTGWGQEEDKRRAQSAGFDTHVTKPVNPDQLASLLAMKRVH